MKFSKDLWVVLVLLLFTVGIAYWAALQTPVCDDPSAKPSVWQITPWSMKLALFQWGAALLLTMFTLSRRFATPLPYTAGQTRLRGEYLSSMAQLFQRAEAASLALELLTAQFRRDLAQRTGLAPTALPEAFAQALGAQDSAFALQIQHFFEKLSQVQANPSEARVLQMAQAMAQLRKEWSRSS